VGQTVFKLPDLGEGVVEGEIVAWHVKPGDLVEEDQSLVDVMTANAFDVLRDFEKANRRFDTIVLDPPGLAKRREGLATAQRAYHELNLRAFKCLKPDGLLLAALIGGSTLSELREAFSQAELDVEGGVSPRVAPFADVRDMGGLLQRAGFALPVADSDTLTVRYDNAFALMADLRAMGATNVMAQRRKAFTRRTTMIRMAEIYQQRFSDPDGRIRATFEIIWISGWAPHEGQQKPLKPGSAKTRLADALGVKEYREED